ncbi:hypothetical protein [Algibacter sp. 2305UL17-15]|uniref:hypothetical protein n=1 Tax=Algibacter sp. 2305UL17-15 TaxID=3231268 RepID=UPI003457965F
MYKKVLFLSVFSLFFVVTSCQDILECIINRKPVLSDNRLVEGNIHQDYFDKITSEIKNEPYDNRYYYDFSFHGDLPKGISIIFDYRDVIIQGRPLERGRFNFTISLYVEQTNDYYEDCENELNDCDGLCEENVSKNYILTIR